MQIEILPYIVVLAFFCELVDSTLGMGYGTTLTPLLLLFGYEPSVIVPAVLFSEFLTGILAGLFHHELGNVDFRRGSQDFKVMILMAVLSIVGVLIAVGIAVSVPSWVVKLYIGLLVLSMGIVILANHNKQLVFSWKRVAGLGFLAAFNKGISGGGYGPVVTGGQILSGIGSRSAIGIASLAEGLTSAVGLIAYMASGAPFPWALGPSLALGAVLSTPLAAFLVSRFSIKRLTLAIGGLSTVLGGYTLARLMF
ncbi:MAG: sulfite exporter TauE/SafE family protein [Anaerolineae bacterium]|nr:sulfite exporter TauE/SafE family protein [Anaerolineae bacterium]